MDLLKKRSNQNQTKDNLIEKPIENNTLELFLDKFRNKNTNKDKLIQIGLVLINFNQKQLDIKNFFSKKREYELIQLIKEYKNILIQKHLLIFLNSILKNNKKTIFLNSSDFEFFNNFIIKNFQLNSNFCENLLFISEIFNLFSLIDLNANESQDFLKSEKFINVLKGIKNQKNNLRLFNDKIYFIFFENLGEFLNFITEDKNIINNKILINTLLKNFTEFIKNEELNQNLENANEFLISNNIDYLNSQIYINLFNTNYDFSTKNPEILKNDIIFLINKTKNFLNTINFYKNKLINKIPEVNNKNRDILDVQFRSIFHNSYNILICITKMFEGPFLEKLNTLDNTDSLCYQFLNDMISFLNFSGDIINFIDKQNLEEKFLLEYLDCLDLGYISLLNINQCYLKNDSIKNLMIKFIFSELKKYFDLLENLKENKNINKYIFKIIDKIFKNLLCSLENIQNIDSCLDLELLIKLFRILYINKFNINQEIILENLEVIDNSLNLFIKSNNILEKKNDIILINSLIIEILEKEQNLYLLSGVINLVFVIYGDKFFDDLFISHNFLLILEKNLNQLKNSAKNDFFLQKEENFDFISDTIQNLEEFINYKKNN